MITSITPVKEDFGPSAAAMIGGSRSASKPHLREGRAPPEMSDTIALTEVMGPSQRLAASGLVSYEEDGRDQNGKPPPVSGKSLHYLAYRKMWMINKVLEVEIKQQQQERDRYLVLIEEGRKAKEEREQERVRRDGELEKRSADSGGSFSDDEFREKKRRRKRDEIPRDYVCQVEGCRKAYG